jgi:FlaG/FlaF family flagellin (archaellin)
MGVGLMMRAWMTKMATAGALAVALLVGGGASTPTQAATTHGAPAFNVVFTCASAVDHASGQVCMHTNAGAALTISVRYCSGYLATSTSLKGTKYANSAGNASWWWKPDTKCRGTATATVRAIWHGKTIWRSKTFTVR